MSALVAALRAQASEDARSALDALPELEPQLETFVKAAVPSPAITVRPTDLLGWIGMNLDADDVPRLSTLHAADLALAYACSQNDPVAQALFVERYGSTIRKVGGRLLGADRLDDLLQVVTAKLLVGAGAEGPRIGQYRGRGELGGWVRVVTTREALGLLRKEPRARTQDLDDLAEAIGALDAGPEVAFLKRTHAIDFAHAFHASLSALTPRQRNLLRYSLVEKLSIDVIGELYGVHRSTAARWIEAARAALCDDTKARLAARLQLGSDALDSLLRLVWSAVDLSIDRLLAVTDEEPD